MLYLSRKLVFAIFMLILTLPLSPIQAADQHKHATADRSVSTTESGTVAAYARMPAPGKKVMIGNDYYFTYGFDKKPKMGTVIVKVEIYKMSGQKDVSLEIKGDAGMPSMKGAHDTGDRPFRISSKGVYLLPVDIVMPGDWEIRLTFLKDGKVIFRGSHAFDV